MSYSVIEWVVKQRYIIAVMHMKWKPSNQILSFQHHNWFSWYCSRSRRHRHRGDSRRSHYCCRSCCSYLESHTQHLSYPFGCVRLCYGLFSHAWTHSFDLTSAMISAVKWRAALYTIQIDILVMSLYGEITSIDLFTGYFHFNVIPCSRCYFGFENSLSWPQRNDCIMYVYGIGMVETIRVQLRLL